MDQRNSIFGSFVGAMLFLGVAVPASAEQVNVGVLTAVSGGYAFAGVPVRNGMVLALEEANKSSELGDLKFNVLVEDSAGDKGQAITVASRFARSDNVLMILGPITSVEATAVAPLANEEKVMMFSTSASKGILTPGPYSFKFQPVGSDNMGSLAEYAIETLAVKSIALVFDRGNDGYVGQKDGVKTPFIEAGVEIAAEEGILASDTDFLALATKLTSSDIDVVFFAGAAEIGANLLIQLRQAGLPDDVRMIGPSSLASSSFIEVAGSLAEGTVATADYIMDSPNPENQAFVEAYRQTYNTDPENYAALGYALGRLAVTAVKNAGPQPTREKVMTEMTAMRDQPTIIGNYVWTMDEERNPSYDLAIVEVVDGKFVAAEGQ